MHSIGMRGIYGGPEILDWQRQAASDITTWRSLKKTDSMSCGNESLKK